MRLLQRLLRDERAQDLAEYGIVLAVIGLGAGIAAVAVAIDVNSIFVFVQTAIHAAL
jgi:Flp pilus assembly pilin Flp